MPSASVIPNEVTEVFTTQTMREQAASGVFHSKKYPVPSPRGADHRAIRNSNTRTIYGVTPYFASNSRASPSQIEPPPLSLQRSIT
jgi:hypothetical protein